jgi:hypothetical protein
MSAVQDLWTPERILQSYVMAKDGNRPHFLRKVFAEDASLEMVVKTESIAFPATTHGLTAIADVLVRDFGRTYENVYTFYMQAPPRNAKRFSCDWLVGMSDKATGSVRVGCGRYDWRFSSHDPQRADQLRITIEAMQILEPASVDVVSDWLAALPYPWCTAEQVAASAPTIASLESILHYLHWPGRSC